MKQPAYILIFSPEVTPRLNYVFGLFFRDILGVDHRITSREDEFRQYAGPKISYADQPLGDELFFYATQLLFRKGIENQQITLFEWEGTHAFFATHPKYTFPFDPFAAAFYLVTRYEEYLPHIKDKHQRFSPAQSLACEKNFLREPLVNIWAGKLRDRIQARYPAFVFPKKHFRFVSTIDVDSAWAFRHKGLMRTAGSYARSLLRFDLRDIAARTKVLMGLEKDPYDTYGYQLAMQKKYGLEQIYFFLVGDYGENDKNVSIDNIRFQGLVKQMADYSGVGLHPSYASGTDPGKLKTEIFRLSDVLKREVTRSRQHFLRVTFPTTYRHLLDLDIREDYTMGYASETGFRASICTPFYFYDLDLELETRLRIYSHVLMDGTLREYMKLSPEEAVQQAKELADTVNKVDGMFITLWHNHTLNDLGEWQGWRKVYEEIVEYATGLARSSAPQEQSAA